MKNNVLKTAALLGAATVGLGAFGAHGLKDFLVANGRLDTFDTAVTYQFYHTLALLAIGILFDKYNSKWLRYSAVSIIIGIIIFSGSLYVLCFTGITVLGAITPFGGVALILGWLFLFMSIKHSL